MLCVCLSEQTLKHRVLDSLNMFSLIFCFGTLTVLSSHSVLWSFCTPSMTCHLVYGYSSNSHSPSPPSSSNAFSLVSSEQDNPSTSGCRLVTIIYQIKFYLQKLVRNRKVRKVRKNKSRTRMALRLNQKKNIYIQIFIIICTTLHHLYPLIDTSHLNMSHYSSQI